MGSEAELDGPDPDPTWAYATVCGHDSPVRDFDNLVLSAVQESMSFRHYDERRHGFDLVYGSVDFALGPERFVQHIVDAEPVACYA